MYQKFKVACIIGLLVSNLFYVRGQKKFRLNESCQLYGGRIAVTTRLLEKQGDSLYIDQRYDMVAFHLSSRSSLTLTPILRSSCGDSLRLPVIQVLGRNQYKAYKRKVTLKRHHAMKTPVYAILKNDEPKWNLQYIYAVPYENWMSGGVLEMQEDMTGRKGQRMISVEYVATIR